MLIDIISVVYYFLISVDLQLELLILLASMHLSFQLYMLRYHKVTRDIAHRFKHKAPRNVQKILTPLTISVFSWASIALTAIIIPLLYVYAGLIWAIVYLPLMFLAIMIFDTILPLPRYSYILSTIKERL